jgi:hypothetical protein
MRQGRQKKAGYRKKFGGNGALDAGGSPLALSSVPNPVLYPALGVRNLGIAGSAEAAATEPIDAERGIVIGNIHMGYGHYRIAMAMASAVRHRGYTPYWFDLNGYSNTVSGRIVSHLNDLYSFGSRLSQKSASAATNAGAPSAQPSSATAPTRWKRSPPRPRPSASCSRKTTSCACR